MRPTDRAHSDRLGRQRDRVRRVGDSDRRLGQRLEAFGGGPAGTELLRRCGQPSHGLERGDRQQHERPERDVGQTPVLDRGQRDGEDRDDRESADERPERGREAARERVAPRQPRQPRIRGPDAGQPRPLAAQQRQLGGARERLDELRGELRPRRRLAARRGARSGADGRRHGDGGKQQRGRQHHGRPRGRISAASPPANAITTAATIGGASARR